MRNVHLVYKQKRRLVERRWKGVSAHTNGTAAVSRSKVWPVLTPMSHLLWSRCREKNGCGGMQTHVEGRPPPSDWAAARQSCYVLSHPWGLRPPRVNRPNEEERDLEAGQQIRDVHHGQEDSEELRTFRGPPGTLCWEERTTDRKWEGDGHQLQPGVLLQQWLYPSTQAHCPTASVHLTMLYGSGQDRFTPFSPEKSGFKIRTTLIRQALNPRHRWKRKCLSSDKKGRGGLQKKERKRRQKSCARRWFGFSPCHKPHPSQSPPGRAQHVSLTLHITPAGRQHFDVSYQTDALLKALLVRSTQRGAFCLSPLAGCAHFNLLIISFRKRIHGGYLGFAGYWVPLLGKGASHRGVRSVQPIDDGLTAPHRGGHPFTPTL